MTSLQFDDSRIVSGGSDGRVKVWDLARGGLVRELGQPAEAVWRVVFEDEKAVVLASRNGKTVMEVWSFAPPEEQAGTGSMLLATEALAMGSPKRQESPASMTETLWKPSDLADDSDSHGVAALDERMADVVMEDIYTHPTASSSGQLRRHQTLEDGAQISDSRQA